MATIEVNRENYVRYSEASLKAAIYMYNHKEENENLSNKERQGNFGYKTKKDD